MKMEFQEDYLGCKQGGDLKSKATGKDGLQDPGPQIILICTEDNKGMARPQEYQELELRKILDMWSVEHN